MCLSSTVFIQVLKNRHFHALYSVDRDHLSLILFHIKLPPSTEYFSACAAAVQ